jgi:predicted HicB family RNase H-like nuclease
MFTYKGYNGKVEYDSDADLFHGEVVDLRDVITFQGRSVDELKIAFRESIDDYIAFCEEKGEKPEKPFTGKLMLRLPPDVHRKVFLQAKKEGKSLNEFITEKLSV